MMDVCVLILCLVECIGEMKCDIVEMGFIVLIVGYVGDGNFYVIVLVDFDDVGILKEVEVFNECMVEWVLDMGGMCIGEYGVGYGKMVWLVKEYVFSFGIM